MSFKITKFFLYAAVFAVAIVTLTTLFPFIVGKYVWFRSAIDFAFIAFLIGILIEPDADRYIEKLRNVLNSPLGIAVSFFAMIYLAACAFGVDPSHSFWSNFERGEGGLQILHLYLFFLLLSTMFEEEKQWIRIFYCSLATAVMVLGYGVIAGIKPQGLSVIGPAFGDAGYRIQGSIGNPAYVAVYLIFILFYALYILITKYRHALKSAPAIWLYGAIAVYSAGFLAAATRGAVMGVAVAVIVALCYLAFFVKRLRRYLLGGAAFVILFMGLGITFRDSSFIQKLPFNRIFDFAINAQTFSDRRIIWKMAWDGFKERPLLGYGPENFLHVFDSHFNTAYFNPPGQFGAWFDRAHSVIFDSLAETGILGFLGYASMFIVFYFLLIKSSLKKKIENAGHAVVSRFEELPIAAKAIVFVLPMAYLIQGLVLFDILPTYINVFLFLAFAYYLFDSPKKQK